VHDIADLEGRGIPGVFVASTEFAEAARAQSRSLGFDPAYVLVAHPIQDRTDAELQALAEQSFPEILGAVSQQ
jgi:hypothetical protein